MLPSFWLGLSEQCAHRRLNISSIILEPTRPLSPSAPTAVSCQVRPPVSFTLSIPLCLHYQTQVAADTSCLDQGSSLGPHSSTSAALCSHHRWRGWQQIWQIWSRLSWTENTLRSPMALQIKNKIFARAPVHLPRVSHHGPPLPSRHPGHYSNLRTHRPPASGLCTGHSVHLQSSTPSSPSHLSTDVCPPLKLPWLSSMDPVPML